jgi:hypothetical protein
LVVDNLIVKPSSDVFLATEFKGAHRMPSNNTYLVDLSRSATSPDVKVRELPFSIRQIAWFPSSDPTDVHLAIVTRLGDVYLAGDSPDQIAKLGKASRLPETEDSGEVGPLHDILAKTQGELEPATALARTSVQKDYAPTKDMPSVFDAPIHLLPPMHLLWRDVLGLPRPREKTGGVNGVMTNGHVELDEEMDEEDKMEVDHVPAERDDVVYSEIPGVEDIFKNLIAASDK